MRHRWFTRHVTRMRRRRWLAAGLATALACSAGAAPSLADGPTRSPEHVGSLRIPSSVCGFPVLIKPVVSRGTVKTFPDGHMLITGSLKESMTNLRNGHHILVNSSGPVRIYTMPDGEIAFIGTGTSWIAQFGGGGGFLRETHGRVVLNATTFGLVHGTSRNICPMIR